MSEVHLLWCCLLPTNVSIKTAYSSSFMAIFHSAREKNTIPNTLKHLYCTLLPSTHSKYSRKLYVKTINLMQVIWLKTVNPRLANEPKTTTTTNIVFVTNAIERSTQIILHFFFVFLSFRGG